MENRIMSLQEYSHGMGANPVDVNVAEEVLDALVELVGSEEEIEAAAKASFDDLSAAFEKGEIEMTEEDVPEKLAMAALMVKLVEMGKIGPEEADSFIADHLGEHEAE